MTPAYLYVDAKDDVIMALVVCDSEATDFLYFGETLAVECEGISFSAYLAGDEPERMREMFNKVASSPGFKALIMRLPHSARNEEIAIIKDRSGDNGRLRGLSYLPQKD